MVRSNNDIVRQLRDILLEFDERKTAQFVGSNQIVAKPYDSGETYDKLVTISAPYQSVGSSFKLMRLTVIPTKLTPNNILLSEVIPDIRTPAGVRISNWGGGSVGYGISKINANDPTRNTYLLFMVANTGTQARVKMYIVANAEVTFLLEDLI